MPLLPLKKTAQDLGGTVASVAKDNWGVGLTFLFINAIILGVSGTTLAQTSELVPPPVAGGEWMYLATAIAAALAQGFALLTATVKERSKAREGELVTVKAKAEELDEHLGEERERRIQAETRVQILEAVRGGRPDLL